MRSLIIAVSIAVSAGSAIAAAPAACPTGLHPAATAELYFGPGADQQSAVSDQDWNAFLSDEVTPRFAAGLPVAVVFGQWRGPTGDFVREPSKALFLVLTGTADERANLQYVRDAYQRRFHQRTMLLVEPKACVSF
jgi:hypothetical protein